MPCLLKKGRDLGFSEEEHFMLSALEEKLEKSEELVKEVKPLWNNWEKSGKLFEGRNRKQAALKEVGRDIGGFLRKKLPLKSRDEVYEEIKALKEI